MKLAHSYHLVTLSPWPFTTSLSALSLFLGNVMLMQNKIGGSYITLGGLASLVISLYFWFSDIVAESTYLGEHPSVVQKGLNLGFLLFVVSEVCVFFSLFFALFYNSLVPSLVTGSLWPPVGILTIDFKSIPLFNTLLLISSGFSITACHNLLLTRPNSFSPSFLYLSLTILLGLLFTSFQFFEYTFSPFTLTDSVYGSSFFILTGSHALHIILGTGLLLFSLLRLSLSHFSSNHHILFSFSAIYWHFVDAVWLILFFLVYVYLA